MERVPTDVRLTDEVLLLRPFQPDDAPAHLAGEDAEQIRWLSGGVSSLDTVSAWIARNALSWRDGGPTYNFAVCTVKDQQLVGMVEATVGLPGFASYVANVTYGIHPSARGRGLARRAVDLVVGFLLLRDQVTRAVIQVDPQNVNSVKVAEGCGFRYVGDRISPDRDLLSTYVRSVAQSGQCL